LHECASYREYHNRALLDKFKNFPNKIRRDGLNANLAKILPLARFLIFWSIFDEEFIIQDFSDMRWEARQKRPLLEATPPVKNSP